MNAGRPLALVLILVVAGGGLLTWWFLEPESAPSAPGSNASGAGARERPAPVAQASPVPVPVTASPLAEVTPQRARELDLAGRGLFYGMVRDAAGEAVAGAEVWYDGERHATSDPGGRYRMQVIHEPVAWEGDRPRFPTVAATHPTAGCCTREAPPRSQRLDLVVAAVPRLHGRVLLSDGGVPPTGVEIEWVHYPAPPLALRPAFRVQIPAAPDGTFTLHGVPAGNQALQAHHPAHGARQWQRHGTGKGDTHDVELLLRALSVVKGQFVPWPPPADWGRAPFRVEIPGGLEVRRAPVGEEGRFSLAFFPSAESARLLCLRAGPGLLWVGPLARTARREGQDLGEIPLTPPARLRGRIDQAALLEQADVQVVVLCYAESPEILQRVEKSPVALQQVARRLLARFMANQTGIRASTRLTPDGRFELGPLVATPVALGLEKAGQVIANLGWHFLQAGETRDAGDLAVPVTLVSGVVRGARGETIARRASVELRRLREGGGEDLVASTRVDDQGRYFLQVHPAPPPGQRYRLVARSAGYRDVTRELVLERAITRQELRLTAGQPLAGRLRGSNGAPLVGWLVHAVPPEGKAQSDYSDAEGKFAVTGLPKVPCQLRVVAPDGTVHELPDWQPGAQLLELTLP